MYFLLVLAGLAYLVYKGVKFYYNPKITVSYPKNKRGKKETSYYQGWYSLGRLTDFKIDKARNIELYDYELTVFRTKNAISCVDSRCPHLGANLGDGCVKDNKLHCPFHNYAYDTNGKLQTKKGVVLFDTETKKTTRQDSLNLRTYPLLVQDGYVYVWFGSTSPQWKLHPFPPLGEWEYRGSSELLLPTSITDIVNNSVDTCHFPYVHGQMIPGMKWFPIKWEVTWKGADKLSSELRKIAAPLMKIDPQKVNSMHIVTKYKILRINGRMEIAVFQVGPGMTYLVCKSNFGLVMYYQQFVPYPKGCRVINHIYTERSVPRWASLFFLICDTIQLCNDANIWVRKAPTEYGSILALKDTKLDLNHMHWWEWWSQFKWHPQCRGNNGDLQW